MLKRILIAAIVSGAVAKGFSMQRAVAREREQDIDVQRWEDEGGHAACADAAERRTAARASDSARDHSSASRVVE